MSTLLINNHLAIPLKELQIQAVRSSGPGGQNVNKVNSKVVLQWNVRQSNALPAPIQARLLARYGHRISEQGLLTITSQRYRDQPRNRADCLQKLREMVQTVQHPPAKRHATKPTWTSRVKRLEQKRRSGERKKMRRPPSWDE